MNADNDALGLVAGALTTVAFVPQVLRILRTRSAHDISWLMFVIFTSGAMLWLWYGVRLAATPIVLTNVATLALLFVILVLKWRYGRDRPSADARDDARTTTR